VPPHLPFPIAFPYHLIGTARDPTARYERLLRCYEATVRYCALVQLSDYRAAGCPDAALNRKLLERLPRNLLLGHWIEIARQVTTLQRQGRFPAFMPEMAAFYFKGTRGTTLTAEAEIFDVHLCAARNDWAHPDQTWPADVYPQKFKEHRALLDQMLEALSFLGRYTLYVPCSGPRPEVVSEALVLMGPTEPPQLEFDLELTLVPQVRDHLDYEMTTFLVDQQDASRQLLLVPLSAFVNRDGTEDVFLFEGCDLRQEVLKRLHYRGIRIGQKPLEVSPGSTHGRLTEHFTAWLSRMRATLDELEAGIEGGEGPSEEDLSVHYFAVQRELIESHTRGFVGRSAVRQALDQFQTAQTCGYLVIRGGPGQGKSAAMAHLVKSRQLPHHFISRTGGRTDPRLILRSLLAQLLPRAKQSGPLPETVPDLTKRLEDALATLSSRGERLVLILDAIDELPPDVGLEWLVTEGLPQGIFVVVTTRPGGRFQQLRDALYGVPHAVHDLAPLSLAEVTQILRASRPELTDTEVERIADVSQGNPLYLKAVADELEKGGRFDLRDLPVGIEGFFRLATGELRTGTNRILADALGLLVVARKPLSLAELGQILGTRQRQVYDHAIRPVHQFLLDLEGGYCFYHARFHDFVLRELLFPDEIPDYHRLLACWLQRSECQASDYRYQSLVYHLYHAGERDQLPEAVDGPFLAEKVQRLGYAALEDVELLSRSLLEAGDPALVERCVALVEGLRKVVGGDVIEETRQSLQGYRPGPTAFRSRVLAPALPSVPGLEVYVGMLPRVEVGADFFEVIPHEGRLVVALGDAPGTGLRSAFVARFIGNVFRRLVEQSGTPALGEVLGKLNATLSAHPYFQTVSMQCALLDTRRGEVAIASAGHPYPVLYSARRGKCDRLLVRGDLLHSAIPGDALPRYEQRRAEIGPGDILVMLTDGLTEDNRLRGDRYGYRFTRIVEERATQGARAIGEAMLDDWRAFPREGDYSDDVTVLVVSVVSSQIPL
jgi:serine phosphatase RsbU (regulator of sigma subunit)